MSTGAVYLRHPNATRQAAMYGGFAIVLTLAAGWTFLATTGAYRWSSIVLALGAVLFGYAAIRLATLKVRVDEHGIWEPDPFRLTYLTRWDDFKKAQRVGSGTRIPFVGIRIVHADGAKHDVEALKIQAGLAGAEDAVDTWLDALNGGKARFAPRRR